MRMRFLRDREHRRPGAALVLCLLALASSPRPFPDLRPADAKRILDEVRRPGAEVVVVNVWATWCLPCREEFPDLVRLYRSYAAKGLRLVLVSADFGDDRQEHVRRFLAEHGVDFPSFVKEEDDMEFIDKLEPRWTGALPATMVYDAKGVLRRFWEGTRPYPMMEKSVREVLEQRESRKEAS